MGWDSQDQLEGFLSEEDDMKFAERVLMGGMCLLLEMKVWVKQGLISIKRSVLVPWASLSTRLVTAWPLSYAVQCMSLWGDDSAASYPLHRYSLWVCQDLPAGLVNLGCLCTHQSRSITWSCVPPCVFSAEVSVTLRETAEMCLSPPQILEGVVMGEQQLFKHSGMSHCSP